MRLKSRDHAFHLTGLGLTADGVEVTENRFFQLLCVEQTQLYQRLYMGEKHVLNSKLVATV